MLALLLSGKKYQKLHKLAFIHIQTYNEGVKIRTWKYLLHWILWFLLDPQKESTHSIHSQWHPLLCVQFWELEIGYGLMSKVIAIASIWYQTQDLRLHIVSSITKNQ
jgi:hypothetical protein